MRLYIRSYTKKHLLALLYSLVLAYAFTATPVHAFGIGLQPATVEMRIKPGARKTQLITLGNIHKNKTISLTLGLADWSLDEDGQLILMPAGEHEKSAANWVRFSPARVTLPPGTSQQVKVEISPPSHVTTHGDHRFALLATTRLPERNQRGETSGVWNRFQLTSLFYLTLGRSESLPIFTQAAINPQIPDTLNLQITNEGNAHARLTGQAHVVSPNGQTLATAPVNIVVLECGQRSYPVKLDKQIPVSHHQNYSVRLDVKNLFSPQNRFRPSSVTTRSLPLSRLTP